MTSKRARSHFSRETLPIGAFSLYFPMQSINLIDNQLVKSFVVQIWFRKNGYHLSLNRTEFESESTNANIGKNLQTVKESGQALSER